MALNPLSFFPPQTPLPAQKPHSPTLPLNPLKNPSTLRLKTLQTIPVSLPTIQEQEKESPHSQRLENPCFLSVAYPSVEFSNTLFFSSAYNVQVIVGADEPEENLIGRFRREVFKAGVVQESKRRRFFECSQEKRKRKRREAARRNRKRRPQGKVSKQVEAESTKKKVEDPDEDNWELLEIDLPYC